MTEPNVYSAVVALVAGIAGTISLARTQATALAGVLVSVTTIPAAAAIGIDAATAHWADLRGALLQLAINLSALLVAGIATLAVYDRAWSRLTSAAPYGAATLTSGLGDRLERSRDVVLGGPRRERHAACSACPSTTPYERFGPQIAIAAGPTSRTLPWAAR